MERVTFNAQVNNLQLLSYIPTQYTVELNMYTQEKKKKIKSKLESRREFAFISIRVHIDNLNYFTEYKRGQTDK